VSEGPTHASIARLRSGGGAARRPEATEAAVRAALTEIPDPELPVLSIVDLGVVHRVVVGASGIEVAILPTFVGCPALDVMRASIVDHLGARFDRPVRVETTFEVPWTSDRISPAGLAALKQAGIAPPAALGSTTCPYCDSPDVAMDSAFGPTQCRSLFYCRACRQPFEALKSV
jgi:ring-1,2-phenylacetyl-CoA epoxidase subunit PaaD